MMPDRLASTLTRDSIPLSASDELLRTWGYDLVAEYLQVIQTASLPPGSNVLELATGTGRMTAALSRLGFHVLTGDLSDATHQQAWRRVTPAFSGSVGMILFDTGALPFRDSSTDIIVCVNTLHELEHPRQCLSELLRVHSAAGTLVLGDFNETGFEVMQNLHRIIYRNDHPRGSLKISDAQQVIKSAYSDVEMVVTPLNITYIASRKK